MRARASRSANAAGLIRGSHAGLLRGKRGAARKPALVPAGTLRGRCRRRPGARPQFTEQVRNEHLDFFPERLAGRSWSAPEPAAGLHALAERTRGRSGGRRLRNAGSAGRVLRRRHPMLLQHCRKAELCDVPGPDDDELAPQPAAARAAVSTTAPSTAGLAPRPGLLWNRRVNNVSLAGGGPAFAAARAGPGAPLLTVKGAGLAIWLRQPGSFLPRRPGFPTRQAAIRRLQLRRSGPAFHARGERQADVERGSNSRHLFRGYPRPGGLHHPGAQRRVRDGSGQPAPPSPHGGGIRST